MTTVPASSVPRDAHPAPAAAGSVGVLLVDDHPVVLLGLRDLLAGEHGIDVVATARRSAEAISMAQKREPDVAVIDFHLGGENGVELACRLGRLPVPPRVIVYSAFPGVSLVAAATVAGASGVIAKTALTHEIYDAIRAARDGRRPLPALSRAELSVLAGNVAPEDRSLFGMLAHGTSGERACHALGLGLDELFERRLRIVHSLTDRSHSAVTSMHGPALHYHSR